MPEGLKIDHSAFAPFDKVKKTKIATMGKPII
jgi:hypothetical protein